MALATTILSGNKHQRRVAKRQLKRLEEAKEDAYIEYHIQRADDERQAIAKANNNRFQLYVQAARRKPPQDVNLLQRSKNAFYHAHTTVGRAFRTNILNKKTVRFAPKAKVRTYNKTDKPIAVRKRIN